jgi:hypothetical protein
VSKPEEFSAEGWRHRRRREQFPRGGPKNDTHASTTDPDALLYRKSSGAESRLAYLGHLLIENRHGLIVDAMATTADGTAEREAATLMLHAQWQAPGRRRTVGDDKAYDTFEFADLMRELNTTPHVTQNLGALGGQCHRRPNHPPRRLCEKSARAATDRTRVRLAENDRLDAQGQAARAPECRLALHLRELAQERTGSVGSCEPPGGQCSEHALRALIVRHA